MCVCTYTAVCVVQQTNKKQSVISVNQLYITFPLNNLYTIVSTR